MFLSFKTMEIILCKTCPALVPKMLEKLTPGVHFCAKAKQLLRILLMADRIWQKAYNNGNLCKILNLKYPAKF
jgi:hypothetical protein